MSIKIMQRVWEHSQHKGTDLLTLLALADNANDDGYCWPGVSRHLAHKTRLSPRTVGFRIEGIAKTTELAVYPNPGTSHDYIITIDMSLAELRKAIHAIAKKRGISTRELALIRHEFRDRSEGSSDPEPAKKLRRGSEDGFGGVPKTGSDEPLVTVIESSSDDEDDDSEIFALYRHISGREIIGDHQPDRLRRMQAEHSLAWVRDALVSAVNANAKNIIGYAEKCLADWQENGHPDSRRKDGRAAVTEEEQSQRWAEIADRFEDEQPEREYTVYTGQDAIARRWWLTAREEMARQLPRETFDAHLRNVEVMDVEGSVITIGFHNLSSREWAQHRLDKVIRRTLARIAGHDVEVKYEVKA